MSSSFSYQMYHTFATCHRILRGIGESGGEKEKGKESEREVAYIVTLRKKLRKGRYVTNVLVK